MAHVFDKMLAADKPHLLRSEQDYPNVKWVIPPRDVPGDRQQRGHSPATCVGDEESATGEESLHAISTVVVKTKASDRTQAALTIMALPISENSLNMPTPFHATPYPSAVPPSQHTDHLVQ